LRAFNVRREFLQLWLDEAFVLWDGMRNDARVHLVGPDGQHARSELGLRDVAVLQREVCVRLCLDDERRDGGVFKDAVERGKKVGLEDQAAIFGEAAADRRL
jgi:hypothetical protein